MNYNRSDNRKADQLREIKITRNYLHDPEGSVLIELGNTKVICTATIDYRVPQFIRESGANHGWLTAEYDMLPRSANKRILRDRYQGKIKGRNHEIQRLIGRSLRAVFDLTQIPDKQIILDCDVIQADGGTRTAAINGSFIALYDACSFMRERKWIKEFPIKNFIGAISVGIVQDTVLLDLAYDEDLAAQVDMNIVMDENGKYIEVQGTSEETPFASEQLQKMLKYAEKGIKEIVEYQKELILKGLTA
ncbi:MAG TPA: ribonuclease PH [Candidatus Cloacimonetes bacterium]|nr:ribonuclease PH [Candidatus Cloacimonadota bacterium]